jgi:hypothetical protein
MFCDILRNLIEKLSVEVSIVAERRLCAGEDAQTGQRFALVKNCLVRAWVRMDQRVRVMRLKAWIEEIGTGHSIHLQAEHDLAPHIHADQ